MMTDGTTICINCHKRVPAESGLCQICGTILEVRTLANQPKRGSLHSVEGIHRVYNPELNSCMHYDLYIGEEQVA